MKKSAIVVFDIDGTLTDSVGVHQDAFAETLESFGFPDLNTDWASYRHHTDSGIFAEAWERAGFAGAADVTALEARFTPRFHAAAARRPIAEISGAAGLLSALEDTPWAVAFATGSLADAARAKLAVTGCDADTAILVTASEFHTREAIVAAAVDRVRQAHGIEPGGRVVSVGDGLWDLTTARALRLAFIGIATGAKADALRRADPACALHRDLSAGLAILGRAG